MGDVPSPATPDPAAPIRRRLAAILDELSTLPRDAIRLRAELGEERDRLGTLLRTMSADDGISRSWAERARHRPADAGRPFIASHGEGGGSPS